MLSFARWQLPNPPQAAPPSLSDLICHWNEAMKSVEMAKLGGHMWWWLLFWFWMGHRWWAEEEIFGWHDKRDVCCSYLVWHLSRLDHLDVVGSFILEMGLGNNEDKGDDLSLGYEKRERRWKEEGVSKSGIKQGAKWRVSHPVLLLFATPSPIPRYIVKSVRPHLSSALSKWNVKVLKSRSKKP